MNRLNIRITHFVAAAAIVVGTFGAVVASPMSAYAIADFGPIDGGGTPKIGENGSLIDGFPPEPQPGSEPIPEGPPSYQRIGGTPKDEQEKNDQKDILIQYGTKF